MKKLIILLAVFFCTQMVLANETTTPQIKIPAHYKTESTFSGNLSKKESFHLIFTKNKQTKKYEIFSYLFNGEKTQKLESITSKEPYNVVSFHKKDAVLSLLLSYTDKRKPFIKKINYNLQTHKKTENNAISHKGFLTSVRAKEISILIYKTDDVFKVSKYDTNTIPVDKEITIKENIDIETFFQSKVVASVKTDEFVANGATTDIKLYFADNTLVFTKDNDADFKARNITNTSLNNKKLHSTHALLLSLDESKLSPVFLTFHNQHHQKFKNTSSFVFEGKIYQLGISKKWGKVTVSSLVAGEALHSFSIDDTLTNYIKGSTGFSRVENFLKQAGKNKHNITITANKTTQNNIILRVDYVDAAYSYHYNWWWHNQLMWHMYQSHIAAQNAIRNYSMPNFGPNAEHNFAFKTNLKTKKKHFFELILDDREKFLNIDLPETVYKEVDKKQHIKDLENLKHFSMKSSCFLEDNFRYIAYDKKRKYFLIKTNKIK